MPGLIENEHKLARAASTGAHERDGIFMNILISTNEIHSRASITVLVGSVHVFQRNFIHAKIGGYARH